MSLIVLLKAAQMNSIYSKSVFFSLIIAFCTFSTSAQNSGHTIHLKSGNVAPQGNIEAFISSEEPSDTFNGHYYRIIQFNAIPAQAQREALEATGIKLHHYIPANSYFASIPAGYDKALLSGYNIRSVNVVQSSWKMTEDLSYGSFPSWSLLPNGETDVIINYYPGIPSSKVREALTEQKMNAIDANDFSYRMTLRIRTTQLQQLALLPFISYIESIDPPSEPENLPGRTSHRSNYIATDFSIGRHYDGTGVNIAMGDDGIIGPHIDYQGRTDQSNVVSNDGNHGDHVAGTIMGAGNLDPKARGMAFGADLYVYDVWDAVVMSSSTYTSPGIRITSTSYSNGCNAGYTAFAQLADQQLRQMPSLMHVFSAGNSGTSDCNYGAGANWGNITGGVKIGKNVITVGNLDYQDNLAGSSSRGPAHDGRIKPEVCAIGTSVYSTVDVNTYAIFSGTSMACPGTSGTLAQLYHAFRANNNNTDPEGGLMKAIMMNSADDLGNAGPDYKFGFGRINAARAAKTIEDSRYMISAITQGATNNHSITIPPGTKQVRIMVYWTDYEAATNSSIALVNDLNMQLTDPANVIYDPWVLDPTPNPVNLNTPATRGIDNLNNQEQVTIENPAAGTYNITINGFAVPQGAQTYFITYELVDDAITVTYPVGAEGFSQGDIETIRWDTYDTSGTFMLEYSTDNGASWNTINSSIAGNLRHYNWNIPMSAPNTGQALVRVSRGAATDVSDAPFSIIPVPSGLTIAWACPDSLQLTWNSVTGATGYEISMLGNRYMDSIDVSTTNSYIIYNINPSNEYWFSVRSLGPLDAEGRRAIAVQKAPGIINCTIPVDASVTNVTGPIPGTRYACHDLTNEQVSITLNNSGTTPLSNIPVNYSINGGPAVTETFTGTIAPGGSAAYTFTAPSDLSAANIYTITTWASYSSDGNTYNDSSSIVIPVMSGTPELLPWGESFESFTLCSTTGGCETEICPFTNGLANEMNGNGDDIDWRTNDGDTPSSSTGPSVDHTLGTAAGKYVYLETSNGCDNKVAEFITPCIDLTGTTAPQLNFWYHMFGTNMGSLHIDVNANGTWINDISTALSGDQGNSWQAKAVSLSPYIGQVINIRFRGITASGSAGDMAVDDISINEASSVSAMDFSNNFSVYPNPADGLFNLVVTEKDMEQMQIEITDMHGKTIMKQAARGNHGKVIAMDLSGLSAGVYFLHISSSTGQYHTKLNKL
jgi:hypothetical protein